MSPNHQQALTRDPTEEWAVFGAATALARDGFRVLPCEPNGKPPLTLGSFRGGALTASADIEQVRDAWLAEPYANVGLAPDGSWIVVDVDPRNGGSLEGVANLGLPIDGYRERTGGGGWHIPLMMPAGLVATKSTTIVPGVEIKARGTYALSPHSRLAGGDWYTVETGRDVWAWPAVSGQWPMLERITRPATATTYGLGRITAEHRREARRVVRGLAAAPTSIARDAGRLLRGDVSDKASASEADYDLALMASFHTRVPEVIAAVLEESGLRRSKWREHPTYLAVTIGKALERRRVLAQESGKAASLGRGPVGSPNLSDFGPNFHPPLCPPEAPTVSYATSGLTEGENRGRSGVILEAVASSAERDASGFARLRVAALAGALNVTRQTILRDLRVLESLGLIHTEIRQPAGLRRERWARLVISEFPSISIADMAGVSAREIPR